MTVGGSKSSQIAQAGWATTMGPALVFADPVVRQGGPGMGDVVLLGQLPLRPSQRVAPRHPGPQTESAGPLAGDLGDGAPVAPHPLAQLITPGLR